MEVKKYQYFKSEEFKAKLFAALKKDPAKVSSEFSNFCEGWVDRPNFWHEWQGQFISREIYDNVFAILEREGFSTDTIERNVHNSFACALQSCCVKVVDILKKGEHSWRNPNQSLADIVQETLENLVDSMTEINHFFKEVDTTDYFREIYVFVPEGAYKFLSLGCIILSHPHGFPLSVRKVKKHSRFIAEEALCMGRWMEKHCTPSLSDYYVLCLQNSPQTSCLWKDRFFQKELVFNNGLCQTFEKCLYPVEKAIKKGSLTKDPKLMNEFTEGLQFAIDKTLLLKETSMPSSFDTVFFLVENQVMSRE